MPNLPLSRGFEAVVDRDDLPLVAVYTWHLASNGQAATNRRTGDKWQKVYLARLILEPEGCQWVQFRNGDKLDCRRENLGLTTVAQAGASGWQKLRSKYSRYKGVTWDKHRQRWIAQAWQEGKNRYLGSFLSEADAAEAFGQASVKFGST